MTHTPDIAQIESDIVEEFSLFDDWMEKYGYLIDLGKALPNLSDDYKTESFRVKGCQSNVWLRSWTENGRLFFAADSDAMITRGLVALLVRVLSGHPPADVIKAPLAFIDEIGLRQHLSTNRANGLNAMIQRMKASAKVSLEHSDQTA